MSTMDDAYERMCKWEKENNKQLSDLSEDEWLDVITSILPLTRYEAEEWLASLRSRD